MVFDPHSFRKNIAGIKTQVPTISGKKMAYINFDNAASTPPLISTIKETQAFMQWYSGVHRGTGYKSIIASKAYDFCHQIVGKFVKANLENNTVIMVKNTTEAINKLSYRLPLNKNDIVISSVMEHHSNDLPWRQKAHVEYIGLDEAGNLCMEDLEKKLRRLYPRVKLLAICGASNVTGQLNKIHDFAYLAHKYDTPIFVDCCQLIPHNPIDMKDDHDPYHIDYLAFSGHKIYSPYGSGCLIGPKKTFMANEPEYKGGGTVKMVLPHKIWWADLPEKEEAGSPNVIGAFALAKSLQLMESIGMEKVAAYEKFLTDYALAKLKNIPGITIFGTSPRVGVISFNLAGLHHALVGAALCYEAGIGVRTGCFCAQPYVRKLLLLDKKPVLASPSLNDNWSKMPGMVRISLGAYNTTKEIDILVKHLHRIALNRRHYLKEYYYSTAKNEFLPRNNNELNKWIDRTVMANFE
jgi:selenocysteine lyase/cysteine desulfurase